MSYGYIFDVCLESVMIEDIVDVIAVTVRLASPCLSFVLFKINLTL